jgi:hypothetical protein
MLMTLRRKTVKGEMIMKQSISLINTTLESGEYNKSAYHEILKSFDEKVQNFLSEQNFKVPSIPDLFLQTTDERLFYAEEKANLFAINPSVVIQEAIKTKLNLLRVFLKRYHIGFIKEAKVNTNGMVEIEIACTITANNFSSKQISAKQTLDKQIDFLKEEGFEIINEKNFGLSLKNCENNSNLLHHLFEDLGAKLVRIVSDKTRIISISFYINFDNLNAFKCEEIKCEIGVSNLLNADEQKNVTRICQEILHVKSTINIIDENMKDVCCSLIESYFSELCKVFNYEGKTFMINKFRYADEREKNKKIENIEKKMSNTLSFQQVRDTLENVKKYVSEQLLEQTGFVVHELSINNYGGVHISFVGCSCPYLYSVDKEKIKDNVDKYFKTTGEDYYEGDPFILNLPENITTFEKIFTDIIPTTRILSIEISNDKNNYCIKKINAVVDTLLPVINKVTA